MSLTKEMLMQVEMEVQMFDDQSLVTYFKTHKNLNNTYPNSFFKYKQEKAFEEILNRGLEEKLDQ